MWFHTSPHPSGIIQSPRWPDHTLGLAAATAAVWSRCFRSGSPAVLPWRSAGRGTSRCQRSGRWPYLQNLRRRNPEPADICWWYTCHFLCRNRQKAVKINPRKPFKETFLKVDRTSHRPRSPGYGSHQGIVPGFPDPNIRCLESPNQKRPHRPWMQEPVPWQDNLAPWSPLDPSYPCKAWRTPIACSRSSDSSGRDPCQKRKWTWAARARQPSTTNDELRSLCFVISA